MSKYAALLYSTGMDALVKTFSQVEKVPESAQIAFDPQGLVALNVLPMSFLVYCCDLSCVRRDNSSIPRVHGKDLWALPHMVVSPESAVGRAMSASGWRGMATRVHRGDYNGHGLASSTPWHGKCLPTA